MQMQMQRQRRGEQSRAEQCSRSRSRSRGGATEAALLQRAIRPGLTRPDRGQSIKVAVAVAVRAQCGAAVRYRESLAGP